MHGMKDLAEFLIERDADQTIVDIDQNIPITYAIDFKRTECFNLLKDSETVNVLEVVDKDQRPLIQRCISMNSWGCFVELLKKGGEKILNVNNMRE